MREYQVRICERLGVKFPGPTRQNAKYSSRVDVFRFASKLRLSLMRSALRVCAKRLMSRKKVSAVQAGIADPLGGTESP